MVVAVLVHVGIALSLVLLGLWGRSHATVVPPVWMTHAERLRRAKTMHRGGTACVVFGALYAIAAAVAVIAS
ncbi:MAG: hypothetical protein QOG20_67 [Pseudonocardiales bacterium]|uniref:hypothetical protein n=1 Tax=Pseudonocardia sp. TaxID=60912 RepID=UPI0026394E38|nr:hypothetical protein [Pseudonocardia sp.]MCW2720796.1 hypothetical protein [Pseudonocardia sp.]MDT7617605.1 hypothetical protein [Pseudonocardiales bacterium]MDT7704460.1 hypothetical protein [Pseudonocardiales bacterium]